MFFDLNIKYGYYVKYDVDKISKAQEAFILQYATDNSIFEIAQEEDIEGIVDLNAELFGSVGSDKGREARYQQRMAQYKANPQIFHVLKQDDIVVGYVGAFPLRQDAINVFVIIGAKQDVKKSRLYGARMIAGTVEFLETLARRGIFVKRLYGTSRTQDGIRTAKGMGFKQVTPVTEEDNLLRFVLDLKETQNPLFRGYQRLLKEAEAANQKEEGSSSKAENSDKNTEKVG